MEYMIAVGVLGFIAGGVVSVLVTNYARGRAYWEKRFQYEERECFLRWYDAVIRQEEQETPVEDCTAYSRTYSKMSHPVAKPRRPDAMP